MQLCQRSASIILIFIFSIVSISAQYTTSSAGGEWTDNSYWTGSAPPYTNVDNHVTIDHRIHSDASITYQDGGGNKHSLTVNDTLIVYGSLTLGSFDNVTIGDNGVLIIFGDFSADVQVDVGNGGYLVVLGDYYMPSGGTSHTNTGDAKTYITGDVDVPSGNTLDCDPNTDTTCGYGDGSDMFDDPIFDFIDEISDETCDITLTASITDESSTGASDGAIDITLTGATSPEYSWSNDSITQDITGLTANDYSLVVFDGSCVIDTSFTVTVPCTAPTITGTSPDSRCGTGTVSLGATASAGTINWYNVSSGGSSLATGTSFTTPGISSSTSFWVDATDGGCTTASRTEVIATVYSLPAATITGNDTICVGDVVTLDAGAGYSSYLWNTAETSQTIDITGPALTDPNTEELYNWSVTVTDANGCQDTDEIDIRVFRIPDTGLHNHVEDTWGN